MRPACAHTCGCKSRRELITTNEVKRNCMRVTECGKEARIVNMRADVQKSHRRRCQAGRAGLKPQSSRDQGEVASMRRLCDEGVRSYLGRSRLVGESPTALPEREVSRGRRRSSRGPSSSSSGKGRGRWTGNSRHGAHRTVRPSEWRAIAAAGGATATD